MELLYGTSNKGKLLLMKRILKPLGIKLKGLEDMTGPIPKVEETGNSLLENARLKADMYYNAFHMPVFSCDSGLYLEGLPEELQPGIHVRRIPGRDHTDEGLTAYYSGLARQFGDLKAQYRNAVCFYKSKSEIYECEDPSLWGKPFLLTSQPHPRSQPGFPLDRISIQISSGKYYYDLPENAQDEVAGMEKLGKFLMTAGF